MIVICFDIGIKNLAWCSYNSDNKKILGWQNYDLINDGDVADIKELYKCSVGCGKNALYTHDAKYYCTKHSLKPNICDVEAVGIGATNKEFLKPYFLIDSLSLSQS